MCWKSLTVTALPGLETGCKLYNKMTYNLLSLASPYNHKFRLKSSIKKRTILKKKFCSNGEEIVETKLASSVIKKLNWENSNLFGNVIKSSAIKKLDFDIGITNIDSKKIRNADTNEILTTINKSVVHKVEHGYKDLDDIDCHGNSDVKHELNRSLHSSAGMIQESNVQNKLEMYDYPGFDPLFSSEEIKADNIKGNGYIELSVKQVATSSDNLLAILEFPLVNKWRIMKSKVESEEISTPKEDVIKKELELLHGENRFPSVTSILNKTMPSERVAILEQWKLRMIEKMGEEAFKQYQQDLLTHGSSLHQNINDLLSGSPEADMVVQPFNAGHWRSLQSVFPVINDVKLLEERVTHPFLLYKGVIDCLAQYSSTAVKQCDLLFLLHLDQIDGSRKSATTAERGNVLIYYPKGLACHSSLRNHLVVIDWKTSKKQKSTLSSTYDSPLQVAAYLGALNFDPKFQHVVNKGLLVIAYEDGSPGHAHLINPTASLKYWQQWLKRLKLYWEMVKEKQ